MDTKKASVDLSSNHGSLSADLAQLDFDGVQLDAGGLKRQIEVYKLPETLEQCEVRERVSLPLNTEGDNPLWISVYTEDGFQAWSSPIFVYQ